MTAETEVRSDRWRDPLDFIDPVFHDDVLVKLVQERPEHEPAQLRRALSQAVAFVKICADNPTGVYAPSPLIDVAWHTLILTDTVRYQMMCEAISGRMVHHKAKPWTPQENADVFANTVKGLSDAGFEVDHELWHGYGSCQCCTQADCKPS